MRFFRFLHWYNQEDLQNTGVYHFYMCGQVSAFLLIMDVKIKCIPFINYGTHENYFLNPNMSMDHV